MNIAPVSVIIPAFKSANKIKWAVESVLGQSKPPSEVIVVDDGSPDSAELRAILQNYGDRVALIRKSNGGAASARNYGIKHATQEWIAFLDADDYWEPDKLEKQFNVIENFPDVGLVSCRWYNENSDNKRCPVNHDRSEFVGKVLNLKGVDIFHAAMEVWTCAVVVKRCLLINDDFDESLSTAEDRDLWIRLLGKTNAYILPDFLATYVQSSNSLSNFDVDLDCRCMLTVVERYKDILGMDYQVQVSSLYRRWAAGHLARHNPRRALPYALKRLQLQPFSFEAWRIFFKSMLLSMIPVRHANTV